MTDETAAARPDYEVAAEELAAFADRHGLTLESTFVPFSQSPNAKPTHGRKEPWPSLNWNCRLLKGGRLVLETPYAAGTGHAPAYKWKAPTAWDRRLKEAAIHAEIQTGRRARRPFPGSGVYDPMTGGGKPILPSLVDVLSSLLSDAGVLDSGGFEEWASEYGYDTDSRSAEATYRACLEIALKVRAALGDAALGEGREIASRL